MLVDRLGLGVRTPPTVKTTRVLAAAYKGLAAEETGPLRHLKIGGTLLRNELDELDGNQMNWQLRLASAAVVQASKPADLPSSLPAVLRQQRVLTNTRCWR